MASSTFSSFAEELLLDIIQHLQDEKSALLNIRATNRTLCRLVGDLHWHNLILVKENALRLRGQLIKEIASDLDSADVPQLLAWIATEHQEGLAPVAGFLQDGLQVFGTDPTRLPAQCLRSCLSKVRVLRTEIEDDVIFSETCQSIAADTARYLIPYMTRLHTASINDDLFECYIHEGELERLDSVKVVCAYFDHLPQSLENLEVKFRLPFWPMMKASISEDEKSHWCPSLGMIASRLRRLYCQDLPCCSNIFQCRHKGAYKQLQEVQFDNTHTGQAPSFMRDCCYASFDDFEWDLRAVIATAKRLARQAESLEIFSMYVWNESISAVFALNFINNTTIAYPYWEEEYSSGRGFYQYQVSGTSQSSWILDAQSALPSSKPFRRIMTVCPWERTPAGTSSPTASTEHREALRAELIKAHKHEISLEDTNEMCFEGFRSTVAFLDTARLPNFSDLYRRRCENDSGDGKSGGGAQ